MTGRPIKFPGAAQAPLQASPLLGEHTFEVLQRNLGLTEEDFEELRAAGAFGRFPPAPG